MGRARKFYDKHLVNVESVSFPYMGNPLPYSAERSMYFKMYDIDIVFENEG